MLFPRFHRAAIKTQPLWSVAGRAWQRDVGVTHAGGLENSGADQRLVVGFLMNREQLTNQGVAKVGIEKLSAVSKSRTRSCRKHLLGCAAAVIPKKI